MFHKDEIPPHRAGSTVLGRRDVLKVGAGMAVAPLLAGVAAGAQDDSKQAPDSNRPMPARAYGANTATSPLAPLQIQRRAVGLHDVLIDILYCGICHSDLHTVRNEWSSMMQTV